MKISIIGTSYVGLPTAVGLAHKGGHEVIIVGRNKQKIETINKGKSPIYEEDIDKLLKKEVESKKIIATNDLDYAFQNSEVTFICVGTPSRDDGGINLSQVENISKQLGEKLKSKEEYHVFVLKSTAVPGTTEESVISRLEKASGKKLGKDFGACMVPEFLREGLAIKDVLNPDRVVIGEYDKHSGDIIEKIYNNFDTTILRTDLKTAEMIKYVSNSFLATKISFINEIGNICKKLGIDVYNVVKGVGLDHRINPKFLNAGIGFGGSCFPKDVKAIRAKANKLGVSTKILDSVLETNDQQPTKLLKFLPEDKKKIGLLGLAFKPGTDDIRDAAALRIIKELEDKRKEIYVYDPQAIENIKKKFPDLNYCSSAEECVNKSEVLLLVTEWPEFDKLSPSLFKEKKVLDGRGTLKYLKKEGIDYQGVCW